MPDISKINNVAVADISKLDAVTFAHGQKVNNQDVSLVTDAHVLIGSPATSDGSDATLGFTSGIDSTYDVYEFVFTNIHAENDTDTFGFQFNAATGDNTTGFNQVITSTFFDANASEGGAGWLSYDTIYDQGNGTAYQALAVNPGNDDDQSVSGSLTLYGPSSTIFVKHFIVRLQRTQKSDYVQDTHIAGYVNTTSPLDEISFKFDSGEIQGGEIKMYGIAKS